MAEPEISIVFDEQKCSKPRGISLQVMLDIFTIVMDRKFPKQGRGFSKYNLNFESSSNKFGNILFTIAGNIYGNRR